jgi:exodeoxyribonuclease VII small subunit
MMAKKQPTFEESLADLEKIIGELEGGTLPLDKMMARYEQGVNALAKCRDVLDRAEKKIEILVKGADGKLEAKPFDADDKDA